MRAFREQIAVLQEHKKNKAVKEDAFGAAVMLILWTLHDKHNWGYAKIKGLIREMWELNELINQEHIEAQELVDVLFEEAGIYVEKGKVKILGEREEEHNGRA